MGVVFDDVLRLGRGAVRKQKNGRYVPKTRDSLLRIVNVLTTKGKIEIALRDSRQASIVGSHWSAIQKYLQTGDDSSLRELKGQKIIDARKKRHLLLTDLDEIVRLGSAGVLSFESLYAGRA